jgi:hypothetical protein
MAYLAVHRQRSFWDGVVTQHWFRWRPGEFARAINERWQETEECSVCWLRRPLRALVGDVATKKLHCRTCGTREARMPRG